MKFESKFIRKGTFALPAPTGTRIMMMPIVLGDIASVPAAIGHWRPLLSALFGETWQHAGRVGYLTIDEKTVGRSKTHRRAGLHVDGVLGGSIGGWAAPAPWASVGGGALTISSHAGCRAWNQLIDGEPGQDGECDHLRSQLGEAETFEAGRLYWIDGLCVHESTPMLADTERQFVRLSMPSEAPWFEGYTVNQLGVEPTGPILPRRSQMDS